MQFKISFGSKTLFFFNVSVSELLMTVGNPWPHPLPPQVDTVISVVFILCAFHPGKCCCNSAKQLCVCVCMCVCVCVCVCEGGGGRWERTCEDVHINSMNCPRMYVWCTDMGSNYWVSNQGFNCMIAACQRSYVCSWGNTHIMWHYVVLFMITVSDNNTTTSSATNTSCTQQWPTASLSYLLNIVTSFRTRLDEHNVELLCFPLSLLHRHLTLVLQVCLVSHKHDNHVIPPFCTYVFNPFVHLLKRVCICGRGICECGIHDIEAVNVCLPFSKASFQGHTHYCSELGNKCDGRLVTSISLYTCTVSFSGSSVRWEPGNEANTSIHSSFIGYTHNWENCSFSKNWNVKPFWKTKIDSSSQTQTDYTSVQLDDGYGEECSTVPKERSIYWLQPMPTYSNHKHLDHHTPKYQQ